MAEAVIVATARTPIGRAYKGALKDVRADDLGGLAVRALLDKVEALDAADVDDVICGTANEAAEQSNNLGRVVAGLGGLPATVPGVTVNRFCASSLQATRMAFHAIQAGEGSTYLAVGVESVSRIYGRGFRVTDRNPRFTDPERDDFVNELYIEMGHTAENVADRWNVGRADMDALALRSQERYAAARDNGFFAREITPVRLDDGTVVDEDECPRPSSADGLAGLKPAFREDGRVTAGNACPLSDGAAAVLVMSDARAHELGLTPLARIVGTAVSGVAPEIMGVGPIDAVRKLLAATGTEIGDIDVVELNEAFAAQVLPVCDELGIDVDGQLNPHGGAIALGHPFGMTGARMVGTLINDLQTLDGTLGLATMCIGGGQGMAMLVERHS